VGAQAASCLPQPLARSAGSVRERIELVFDVVDRVGVYPRDAEENAEPAVWEPKQRRVLLARCVRHVRARAVTKTLGPQVRQADECTRDKSLVVNRRSISFTSLP